MAESNPLLQQADNRLPDFNEIKPEHVIPAIKEVLTDNRKEVEKLHQIKEPVWDNVMLPLQRMENRLERTWSPVSHLNAVVNSEALREAYTACLPLLSDYNAELGQDESLFSLITQIKQSGSVTEPVKIRVLENWLKKFRLSGVDLCKEDKIKYKQLTSRLSESTSKFSDNVLDATNNWNTWIKDVERLDGLPESSLSMLGELAKQQNKEGWLITLDFPSYLTVMTYCDDRDLREKVYRAYVTKASAQADNKSWDNAAVMEEIVQLRTERANLLGFKNFAEQSLYNKMADKPETVIRFLEDLLERSIAQAKKEIETLKTFARQKLGITDLSAWDQAYASEKLKQQQLGFSSEELKPWFSVEKVCQGMFDLVQKLYGIEIIRKNIGGLWHDDVQVFEIKDKNNHSLALFYLDMYARRHKRGGAWMGSYCGRFRDCASLQTPVAWLTCNATPAVKGKPALITHDEVITLFHEFGHGLHHMLTRVEELDISGINGVEWDAVELPSQFMENWCWEKTSLDTFALHYETAEPIPDELFQKLQKSRHFNAAISMVRQLEFSLFDMQLHQDTAVKTADDIQRKLDAVRATTSLLPVADYNRFQNAFTHIFAGGYAAGYYSYKWAEVLSADAFAMFEENGLFDETTAQRFLTEILQVGGSRPANDSFYAFRGREPSIDALLKYSGIDAG